MKGIIRTKALSLAVVFLILPSISLFDPFENEKDGNPTLPPPGISKGSHSLRARNGSVVPLPPGSVLGSPSFPLSGPAPWLRSHDPIRIEGDQELNFTAQTEDWPGNGSFSDPYIIEGIDIDAQGGVYCLYISNTTSFVTIRNSSFHNATYTHMSALTFTNCKNILVHNCSIFSSYSAILLHESSKCNINDSRVERISSRGAVLSHSSYCSVKNIDVLNVSLFGLYLDDLTHSRISGSEISQCGVSGICVVSSYELDIDNNTISFNRNDTGGMQGIGIRVSASQRIELFDNVHENDLIGLYLGYGAIYNNIGSCYFYNCGQGILLKDAVNNNFGECSIKNTRDVGISMNGSRENEFIGIDFENVSNTGMKLFDSHSNTLSGFQMETGGVSVLSDLSTSNTFQDGRIVSEKEGMVFEDSSWNDIITMNITTPPDSPSIYLDRGSRSNELRFNELHGGELLIDGYDPFTGYLDPELYRSQDIDGTNLHDDLPIIYLVGEDPIGEKLPRSRSQVFLIDCGNISAGESDHTDIDSFFALNSRNIDLYKCEMPSPRYRGFTFVGCSEVHMENCYSYSRGIDHPGLVLDNTTSADINDSVSSSDWEYSVLVKGSSDFSITNGSFDRMFVSSCSFGNISENHISFYSFALDGLRMVGSNDIVLYKNTYSAITAINCSDCDGLTIEGSDGIVYTRSIWAHIKDSRHITIRNVNMKHHLTGLLIETTQFLTVENCEFTGGGAGLHLEKVTSITIDACRFSSNDFGIRIYNSTGGVIVNSLFDLNEGYAITAKECRLTKVYRNSFIRNNGAGFVYDEEHIQCMDSGGPGIQWYRYGYYGNHWSDWGSGDNDHDGFVDLPYVVDGNSSEDRMSLMFSPIPLASAPDPFRIGDHEGSITLSWLQPIDSITGEITGFVIYRGYSPDILDRYDTDGTDNRYRDSSVYPGETYYYQVRALNEYGEGEPTEILSIMVDETGPFLNILYPEGDIITNERSVTLLWESEDQESGIENHSVLVDGPHGREEYSIGKESSFTLEGLVEGSYLVKIVAVNGAGTAVSERIRITVDLTPPNLSFPYDGPVFTNETPFTLQWFITDEGGSDLSHAIVSMNGSDWSDPISRFSSSVDILDGDNLARVKAYDRAGNMVSGDMTIILDRLPPDILLISPANGERFGTEEIEMRLSISDPVSGTLDANYALDEGDPRDINIGTNPVIKGVEQGFHTLTVTSGDRAGNIGSITVDFEVDLDDPSIIENFPRGGEIEPGTEIWTSFDEVMYRDKTLITVSGVNGDVGWDGDRIIFRPRSDLDYGKTYTVTVTGYDLVMNPLGNFSWNFTTRSIGEFYGLVTDRRGRPISGALVEIRDGAYDHTDSSGKFHFRAKAGKLDIVIKAEGFNDLVFTVVLEPGDSLDLGRMELREEETPPTLLDRMLPLILPVSLTLLTLMLAAALVIARVRRRKRTTDEFFVGAGISRPDGSGKGVMVVDEDDGSDFEITLQGEGEDYYSILNIEPNASDHEIRKAYRRLARYYHPDQLRARGETSDEFLRERMRQLNDAKEVLLNPLRREMYDMSLWDQTTERRSRR